MDNFIFSSVFFSILLMIEQHTGIALGLWSIISTVMLIIWMDFSLSDIFLFNSVNPRTILPELGYIRLCWWINKNCFCSVRSSWLSWNHDNLSGLTELDMIFLFSLVFEEFNFNPKGTMSSDNSLKITSPSFGAFTKIL